LEIPLLNDIVIIFGLAIAVLFICHRLRVPAVVGFLLTGILVWPYGFGLVKAVSNSENTQSGSFFIKRGCYRPWCCVANFHGRAFPCSGGVFGRIDHFRI
jgi:hypothetical protein